MTKLFSSTAVAAIACYTLGITSAFAKPDEASMSEVANCHFIRNVDGSSGYGKNNGWKPIAKADAEKKAGKLGATHIVWTHTRSVGGFNGSVSARAYSCNR